ncbi:MAG: BREX-1 system phosphatase PglZ type A [Eubacteriales bacterium]|nr:BREX-1 system phosphatase PglZ type A [Eubacteriales bacterium]
MDIERIQEELNQRFQEPLPDFYRRRIVFWYDEEGEFQGEVESLEIPNVKVLILTGSNNFQAKRILCQEDRESNFLVYRMGVPKSQEEDWLLNVELYSEEFRADLISIWMNEMGLSDTEDFRRLVKDYRKFFGAKTRRTAFGRIWQKQKEKGIAGPAQFHLAVLSAITGCTEISPEGIIRGVLRAEADEENGAENPVLADIQTYEAESLRKENKERPFWALARQASGYIPENQPTTADLLVHVFVTGLTRNIRTDYLEGLEKYISMPHQTWCYNLVSDWIATGEQEIVKKLLRRAEYQLNLPKYFERVPVSELAESDLFPCTDECILTTLMTDIGNHIIDVEKIIAVSEKRRTTPWFQEVECFYEGIYQVARMQEFYLSHADGFHTVEPAALWREYTGEYYKMDSFYRKYHMAFARGLESGKASLEDLFKQVTERVEGLYTHWFLDKLGSQWTNVAEENLQKVGRIMELPQQVDFYRKNVLREDSRVFVIISDALRYEVAAELAEELQQETQCTVELNSCEGIFPTVTKYGMAALLPHKELTVEQRENGTLQVLADGMSTEAGNRDKVLKATNENSVALKYQDILPMKRAERSALVKGMDVVYIYHDKVDEASHTADSMVFPACTDAIREIRNIVRMIRNEFSGTRVFITADHGFLYTYSPLTEGGKVSAGDASDNQIIEMDRRYIVTEKGAQPEFLVPVKFPDNRYDAFAPRENVRIRKKGGGLNFVHGGISLQEMVVPVIEYHYLRNDSKTYLRNRERYDTRPAEVTLLSASRKLSNRHFALNFYQTEPVGGNLCAENYTLYFEDENGSRISDVVRIIGDRTSEVGQDRIFRCSFNLKTQNYSSSATYYLVLEGESGTLPPKREPFQIDIANLRGGDDNEEFNFFGN